MNTGERLKRLRTERGYSQEDVAKLIGVGRTTYLKYENGDNKPTRKLKELSALFNVTTDYLLGNDHPTPGYYDDPEVAEMANRMKDNPDMKILFDASKKLSKGDLQFVIDMVHRMKKE